MRKLIRKFLQRYGYDIIKTDDRHLANKRTRPETVFVGRFPICMPGNNIQLRHYREFPDMNSQLGRLAAIVAGKYPGSTVVDVGANVGDTIAVIKSAVDAPVIGIEGDDVSYMFLEDNVKQFRDVQIVKTYLGEKPGEKKAALAKEGWNTTIIPAEEGARTLRFKTLDQVLQEQGPAAKGIKLLKVDVEGFDTIVLRGAYDTTRAHHPVIFLEYNRDNMKEIGEDGLSTLLSFREYGYDAILFFDHRGRFLVSTTLANTTGITQLHQYAIGKNNLLGYYDICLFHGDDQDLAEAFIRSEENKGE